MVGALESWTRSLPSIGLPGLALLAACGPPLDPDDVRFFTHGQPYTPQGLLCGLAYDGGFGQNMGASCQDRYDPALKIITAQDRLAAVDVATGETRDLEEECPPDYVNLVFGERDSPDSDVYGYGRWASCAGPSNLEVSSGDLRDVPQGAVCGLSSPTSLDTNGWFQACEGVNPSESGTCPEGYRLRWVPDFFYDGVDDECLPDGSPPVKPGADAILFCEVDADHGCLEGECLDSANYEGILCGLHIRGEWSEYAFGGQEERVWETPYYVPYGAEVYDGLISSWFEPCSAFDEALSQLLPALEAAASLKPSCMGEDISSGQCPDGWEMDCAPAWSSGLAKVYTGLCWCTPEGARQRLAEEDIIEEDTGGV